MDGGLDFLVDLTTGYSKFNYVAQLLTEENDYDLCLKYVYPPYRHTPKILPVSGIVNTESHILLSPSAVIDIDLLVSEIDKYNVSNRLLVPAEATVIRSKGFEDGRHRKYFNECVELEKYCHGHIPEVIINRLIDQKYCGLCEVPQGCVYGHSLVQALAGLNVPISIVRNRIGVVSPYFVWCGDDIPIDSVVVSSGVVGYPKDSKVCEFSRVLFEHVVRRNDINMLYFTGSCQISAEKRQEFEDYFSSRFSFECIKFV